MNGENQLLVTNDPVDFEKPLVEVHDFNQLPITLEEFTEYISN